MYNIHNKKRGLNIVDITLIFIAIVIIIFFANYFFLHTQDLSGKNNSTITYVLKLDNLDANVSNVIKVRSTVYDSNGNEIGKIKKVEYVNITNNDPPKPQTALVSITAKAYYDGAKFYISNQHISAGRTYNFHLSDYDFSNALCVNIIPGNITE